MTDMYKLSTVCSYCGGECFHYARDGSKRLCNACNGTGKPNALQLLEEVVNFLNDLAERVDEIKEVVNDSSGISERIFRKLR